MVISDLQISAISDTELEETFHRVLVDHKDAITSIHQSMKDADTVYRKYLNPGFVPIEEQAKKDRASLNKAEKNIAEKFASLKAAYEKPLGTIEMNIKEIRNAIKTASSQVDDKVKAYEEAQKAKKRDVIQAYFDSKNFDLAPLDMFFDDRWLNKGYKLPAIEKEIDAKVAEIYGNIKVLENIADHGSIAKAFYLETLDMGAALSKVQTLKDNAVKLAREQVEREERERQAQVSQNAAEERREEQQAVREERTRDLAAAALDIEEPAIPDAPPKPAIMEFTIRFRGTEQQLLKLREHMTEQGIAYEKLDARYM
jgi:hypothetical protein